MSDLIIYAFLRHLLAAIPYQPVLSNAEDKLFVSLSTNSVFAIDADLGTVLWGFTRENANPSSSVVISPDDLLIYLTWVSESVPSGVFTACI